MHPYWIQKIEESRKTAVTTFWVSMILIVLVPLLLVLHGDAFLILAMFCFAGAALRLYWNDEKQYTEFFEGAKKEADAITEHRMKTGMFQEYQEAPHPEMVDKNGVALEPEYLEIPEDKVDSFFQESIDLPEQSLNEQVSADDMQLADPSTHPAESGFKASRKAKSRNQVSS